jgi:hypothetical protein
MTCAHDFPAGLFQVPFAANWVTVTPTPVATPPMMYGFAAVPSPVIVNASEDEGGVCTSMWVGSTEMTYGLFLVPEPSMLTPSPGVKEHEQMFPAQPHLAKILTRFSSVWAPASRFQILKPVGLAVVLDAA